MDRAGGDGTAIGLRWLSRNVKSQKLMQSTSARFVIINMNKMAIDENHSGSGNGFNNDQGDHF